MTTKKNNSKKSQIKNETPIETAPVVDETPKELTAEQIALRNEVAIKVYGVEDYTTMSEDLKEKLEYLVSKMKVKRARKAKEPKAPKRTAGRLIAPTLRVVDENAILKAFYGMKAQLDGKTYKGGWGEVTPETMTGDLMDGLMNIIQQRNIADDTSVVTQ